MCLAFANSVSALQLLGDKSLSNANMLLAKQPKSKTPDKTNNELRYFMLNAQS